MNFAKLRDRFLSTNKFRWIQKPYHCILKKSLYKGLNADWLLEKQIELDVLRLDLIHPIISGNKWFKLQYYLQEALQLGKATVATFGGAYSNHILATAFACKVSGLQSVGFIRGEKPEDYSPTLKQAEEYGMQLIFISRDQYKQKEKVADEFNHFNWYWIAEGGYGINRCKGCRRYLSIC